MSSQEIYIWLKKDNMAILAVYVNGILTSFSEEARENLI